LKERLVSITGIGAVILYGSVARGDASSKSDIDLMIVPLSSDDISTMEKELQALLHEIEQDFRLQLSFSYTMFTGNEDPFFLWETLKDGIVIFCRAESIIPSIGSLKPHALISYSLAGQDGKQKKRTHRFLFESKDGAGIVRSNRMEYVAPGVILVSLSKTSRITDYFDKWDIHYSLMKIWR